MGRERTEESAGAPPARHPRVTRPFQIGHLLSSSEARVIEMTCDSVEVKGCAFVLKGKQCAHRWML